MKERTEFEPTPERVEVDYERYREIADALNPAFRKTGIVDAAGYDRAMRDPRTVRIRVGEGAQKMEMPLLAPIEHVSGYDFARTRKLTGRPEVLVMALPMVALTDAKIVPSGDERSRPDLSTILVETDHADTEDTKQILPDLLANLGPHSPHDFLDSRIDKPELQAATMAMYRGRFAAVDEQGELIPKTELNFHDAYEQLEQEEYPLTQHTKLLDVAKLRQDEATMDELWDLCKDRFEWLGDAHPVSMEDTPDFFKEMVLNDDTHTIVRYDDEGKIRCLGFFMSSMGDWVKQSYIDDVARAAKEHDDRQIYFYGMASNSDKAMHYSRDIVQLLSQICKKMGGSHQLTFESTNMSGQYIPKIVETYVEQSDGVRVVEPVQKTDQVDYWYLAPTTAD